MIVWLASFPRSGNTLLRIVLNRCFGLRSYSVYDDKAYFSTNPAMAEVTGHQAHGLRMKEFIEQSRASPDIRYIKTHALPEDDAQAIYVVRDGRAALVSYRWYLQSISGAEEPLEPVVLGETWAGDWSAHVRAWLLNGRPNTLAVRYERLAVGDADTLGAIGAFLGRDQIAAFDIDFEDLRAIESQFFRSGLDGASIAELERDCGPLFHAHHGDAMRALGYLD